MDAEYAAFAAEHEHLEGAVDMGLEPKGSIVKAEPLPIFSGDAQSTSVEMFTM